MSPRVSGRVTDRKTIEDLRKRLRLVASELARLGVATSPHVMRALDLSKPLPSEKKGGGAIAISDADLERVRVAEDEAAVARNTCRIHGRYRFDPYGNHGEGLRCMCGAYHD